MNAFKAVQDYITKMLKSVPDMKVLILDSETQAMIGNVYSQTEIIAQQVFLVEPLVRAVAQNEEKKSMGHLKAVVYVRPTQNTVDLLCKMLKSPIYKEYHIFFTNIVADANLKALAEADHFEVVRQVKEYYGDFYALEEGLFHCNLLKNRALETPHMSWTADTQTNYNRTLDTILASLLALKKRPVVIRYQGSSDLTKDMAYEVARRTKEESTLFHTQGEAVLIILDRREDPVTPLLQQWTYQAMVHELLGIHNNRVDLKNVPNIKKDSTEVVLSSQQDQFFRSTMYLNLGDLGGRMKQLVQDYQRNHPQAGGNFAVDSIADMQKFVEDYPEFKLASGNVSKHTTLTTELSRISGQRDLLRVSELEQELVCGSSHDTSLQTLISLLNVSKIRFDEKLRLVMLYALRYEMERNDLPNVKQILRGKAQSIDDENKLDALDAVLKYSLASPELFEKKWGQKLQNVFGLRDVVNVFTQHRPLLVSTLRQLIEGKLKPQSYPFVDASAQSQTRKAQHIIVFIVGGVTYEEQAAVAQINTQEAANGINIMLGGSCVHNSTTFLADLLQGSNAKDRRSSQQFLFEEKSERESI